MSTEKKRFSLNSLVVILIITVTAIVPVLTMADTVGEAEALMIADSLAGSSSDGDNFALSESLDQDEDSYSNSFAVDGDEEFDVALTTEISNIYFTNGTLITKENQVPGFGVYGSNDPKYPDLKSAVPAYKNGYIEVENTLYNQGTVPVKNIAVRIYYDSDAYEHVIESVGSVPKNNLWLSVPATSKLVAPVWLGDNFSVKTNTFTSVIDSSAYDKQNFYLKVKDTNLPIEKYYIASEIVSFQDKNGVDKSAYDIDSIPNTNPNDDLNGHDITTINGMYERDNDVSGKGISELGGKRTRQSGDEDDFDFTFVLLNDLFYDMALQTNITNVFDNDGSLYKENGLAGKGNAIVPAWGSVELGVDLINQGSLPVTNSIVYVYVPKAGYTLLENEKALKERPMVNISDSIWSIVENPKITPSNESYMNGDYYVLQGNFSTKLSPGHSRYTLPKLYLNVKKLLSLTGDETGSDVSTNPAYYIAAEIVEFADEAGTKKTSDINDPIFDIDSIPDDNPNNDLTFTDSDILFQTNITDFIAAKSIIKEKSGEITKRGYVIPEMETRTQLNEDEDDFDFTFISKIK